MKMKKVHLLMRKKLEVLRSVADEIVLEASRLP